MRGLYRMKRLSRRLRFSYLQLKAKHAVKRFPTVHEKKPHDMGTQLLISLTSYPPRFAQLGATLRSLLDQTLVADAVLLWVADDHAAKLPEDVLALEKQGLKVRTCPDIRSYKKLLPALKEWPNATIITADDDVYYPPNWLDSLVSRAKEAPTAIVGARVHALDLNEDGTIPLYRSWELATKRQSVDGVRKLLFPTGVGGVLYPPKSLHADVFDEEQFMALCPRGDDIWFFWMARRAGTQHIRARDWFDVVEWPDSQRTALYVDNMLADGNDAQIKAMEEHFGRLQRV